MYRCPREKNVFANNDPCYSWQEEENIEKIYTRYRVLVFLPVSPNIDFVID